MPHYLCESGRLQSVGTMGLREYDDGYHTVIHGGCECEGVLLKDPHMLQLGMIGSCALVNYGSNVLVKAPGIEGETYIEIANFDCYDMIIGTPFMRNNKVKLDFEHNIVIVNGVVTPTCQVVLDGNDGWLHRYRLTDKRRVVF